MNTNQNKDSNKSTSESDFNALFLYNPIPNWVYNLADYSIIDVNHAAIALYGYTKEAFLSMSVLDLSPKEEISQVIEAHQTIHNQEGTIPFGVFLHNKKSGEMLSMDIYGHKVMFQGQQAIMISAINVTDSEKQFQDIKASEEKLKAAASIANLGYWRLEMDGNTLTWSDEIYKIWGVTKETFSLSYENFVKTVHPDDLEEFEREQANAFAGIKTHDTIHRILLPNGSIKWVHERGRLVKNDIGKPIAFEGTVQDITAQRKEEQRLKLLESVITHTNDAVLITEAEPFDEPGPRILYVNEAFTRMTGYSTEEVVGQTPRILQGPNSDKNELQKLGAALRRWESCEITTINYKKNGDPFWIHFTISPVADEKGWYTHWIAIERDVTAAKNNQIQNDLLAKISQTFNEGVDLKTSLHELCNLIATYENFNLCEIWLPSVDSTSLRLSTKFLADSSTVAFYNHAEDITEVTIGEGLPGMVWKEKKSIVWGDLQKNPNFLRREAAKKAKIRSILGIPLKHQQTIVGVLVVGTPNATNLLTQHQAILSKFESFIGSEIYRKRLENDLFHLFEALPDLICLVSFDGKFLKINKAGCTILGYQEEELVGFSFIDFIHPDDKDVSGLELQDFTKGSSTFQFENRYLTKTGEIVWLSWHCNSLVDEKVVYATAKNITNERKLEELLNNATTMTSIGGWEIDLINNRIVWSDEVHKIHETNPKHHILELESAINFYKEDHRAAVNAIIQHSIVTGDPFDFEAPLITAKGNEKWVRCIGKSERIAGVCTKIFGSIQDIHSMKTTSLQITEILGSISDAFYALDKNWKFTYFNKEAELLLDRKREDVIGKSIWDEFAPARDTILETIYKRVAASGNAETYEYFYPGTNSWYEINTYPSNGGVSSYFKNIDERKKAAEDLKLAFEEKIKIIESIGDAFFTMTRDFIVTYWNKTAEKLLGVKREEVLGKNLWTVFPDAVHLASFKNYHKVLKTQQPITFEDYFGKWLEVNAYPSNEGITVFFRDITLRKEADYRLQKAFDERNKILESIGDAFFAVDTNWIVTYWNKEAEKVLGRKKEGIVGKHLWEEYADAIESDFYKQYHKAVATGENVTFEEFYATLNKWFEVTAYPNAEGLSVYFKDVSLRKQTDIKILEANERFEKISEATNDAIWDWNIHDNTLYWGEGFKKLFGYDIENITPSYELWLSLIHPDDVTMVLESLHLSTTNLNIQKWSMEYRFKKANGDYAYVIDKGVIIRDAKGKSSRMLGAITDITFRKRYELELYELNTSLKKHTQELELANEELDQFAFTASHDLQEPLRMITSFMDLLKRKYGHQLDDKAHQYIHFATDGAKRMKRIIIDLLEYSRAGRFAEVSESIDLNEVMEDYLRLRRKIIQEKNAQINFGDLPTVVGEKAPLVQTIHSLLDNAIKYSKTNIAPEITISVEDADSEWIFKIQDEGIGIDELFFEKIFIIFQRLHNRNQYDGTGIGLAIVKKHVEMWGGRVWVTSELDKGSTFYFTLNK
ncbi:PAS domain S-box protein [Flavobacterium orientale]|uniref:histidine kinase n=1 Tax=Flavobacterium orientale TaxID=1756020 RepID=A0A916Y8Z2_9FLAO|nr:PAS domain S-box protein [Flavobacterium orientale]GGD34766.1 hypothetical protein GCM10011343_25800 [Flavobacterium orientale]